MDQKKNEDNTTQSPRIPHIKSNGQGTSEHNRIQPDTKSSSEQEINGNNEGRYDVVGKDARNGLTVRKSNRLGGQQRRNPSANGERKTTQPQNVTEDRDSLGRGLLKNTTYVPEVDELVKKYSGQKLTNEQVAEVVAAACFVSDEKQVRLKDNLQITEALKDIVQQFQSGGTAKKGGGILDEYYTPTQIVDAFCNLLPKALKTKKNLSVLEPSVGLGNFIYATKSFINPRINAFEINETTAKIAKILHPAIEVNLRSFETEFIDDKGFKKDAETFSNQYDLVIGNPPYGSHRGLYKGLGEESGISKYEDYFVKRSLDVLKENGILAMVLPSGWLN